MANNNTLFIQTQEMSNVIIEADAEGHNAITRKRDLKYNRLLNNRNTSCVQRKNIVIIHDKEIKDTIIEADDHGNNTARSLDEYAKEEIDMNSGNIFKGLLLKIRKKKDDETNLIDSYLTEKRESLQEKLKKATEFHKFGWFAKANDFYESALDKFQNDSYPDEFMLDECDILAIKFAIALSKIEVNDYSSLCTAEEILISLIENDGAKFPSLYYYLAKVYYTLHNFNQAKKRLEDGLKALEGLNKMNVLNWPGTKDNMVENSTTYLEKNMKTLFDQCKVFHLPDAKCYFELCEMEQNHIYFRGPSFNGYVKVKCTNKCNFNYHRLCWKKHLKFKCIKKPNNLIDKICETNDCFGSISKIIIFDELLQVLSSFSCNTSKESNKTVKNGSKFIPSNLDKKPKSEVKETPNISTKKDEVKIEIKSEKDGDVSVSDKQDLSSAQKGIPTQVVTDSPIAGMAQRKNFTFNTNAKEYVPYNQTSNFKLHNISIANNFIKVSEEDTDGNNTINSSLNSNAKEYVPPLRVIKMLEGKVIMNDCERSTQTIEKFCSQAKYDLLKCDINILQQELFKTEENYNDLLDQYETLKRSTLKEKSDVSTETDPIFCDSCQNLYSVLKEKDELCIDLIKINEQLELKIKNLQQEVNELQAAKILDKQLLSLNEQKLKESNENRLLDREIFTHNEHKFMESNKVLINKIKVLVEEKDSLQNECKKYRSLMESNDLKNLQKVLLEQIGFTRNFYLSYINMFENKCKHMIWELEDIKSFTNSDTLPSVAEVEENLNLWRQGLNTTIKNHAVVMIFFENIYKKYTTTESSSLVANPLPTLIPEPPSIVLRHFKSLFLVNKRLEQELNKHMTNYYKMLSMPYPGVYPYGISQSPISTELISESERFNSDRRYSLESTEGQRELSLGTESNILKPPPGLEREPGGPIGSEQEPLPISSHQPPVGSNREPFGLNLGPSCSKPVGSNQERFDLNKKPFGSNQVQVCSNSESFGSNQVQSGSNLESFDSKCESIAQQEFAEEPNNVNLEYSVVNASNLNNSDISTQNVVEENASCVESQTDEVVKRTKPNVPVEDVEEPVVLPLKRPEKDYRPTVVGQDGLLFKLQQKYPLTPPKILQDAVKTLREARGGLTGIDSKTMMIELKLIINDLWKRERLKPGYKQMIRPEKQSPWASINNEVHWQNSNTTGNCAICFEKMNKSNSTQLRCQHVFHTQCIQTWLKTNGICPICRSYTTLDVEFPPLK